MQDNKGLSSIDGKQGLPVADVAHFYERQDEIYAQTDRWHQVTHAWIHEFIHTNLSSNGVCAGHQIVNLGSGGQSYGIPESKLLHIDLVPKCFTPSQQFLLADIQNMSLNGRMFDICLCVGSVINYCDAALVLNNISHLLRPGGELILEFESSSSLELMLSDGFGKDAALITSFYQDQSIRLWAYSERYINGLLQSNGFHVSKRRSFHHLSPLIYLLTKNSNVSARFHALDFIFRNIPRMKIYCSNIIFSCQKAS